MPYSKYCKPTRQHQEIRTVIRDYMDRERKTCDDMASALSMTRQTYGKKLDNPAEFKYGELVTIKRYLRIPCEELRQVSYL